MEEEPVEKKVRVPIWTPEDFQDIKVFFFFFLFLFFFFFFKNFSFQVRTGQSSIAGAGSGEFHMYNERTRRERERLAKLQNEDATKKELAERDRKMEELRRQDEERTAKNRAKRQKRKKKDKKANLFLADDDCFLVLMMIFFFFFFFFFLLLGLQRGDCSRCKCCCDCSFCCFKFCEIGCSRICFFRVAARFCVGESAHDFSERRRHKCDVDERRKCSSMLVCSRRIFLVQVQGIVLWFAFSFCFLRDGANQDVAGDVRECMLTRFGDYILATPNIPSVWESVSATKLLEISVSLPHNDGDKPSHFSAHAPQVREQSKKGKQKI
jgi:hypothetical protein